MKLSKVGAEFKKGIKYSTGSLSLRSWWNCHAPGIFARGTLLARASLRGSLPLPHRRACSQAGWRRQTSRGSATNKQTKKKETATTTFTR